MEACIRASDKSMYSASDPNEGCGLTFIELAHKTLSGSNITDLRVGQIDIAKYLHRQECILSNSNAGQPRLSKTSIVLSSDSPEIDIPCHRNSRQEKPFSYFQQICLLIVPRIRLRKRDQY